MDAIRYPSCVDCCAPKRTRPCTVSKPVALTGPQPKAAFCGRASKVPSHGAMFHGAPTWHGSMRGIVRLYFQDLGRRRKVDVRGCGPFTTLSLRQMTLEDIV